MKAIVAILLLTTAGCALADTIKPIDRPIVIYKAGQPFIFDGMRRMCRPQPGASDSCATLDKPEAEKKPAPKGIG